MKKRLVSLLTAAFLVATTLASVLTVGAKDVKDFNDVKSTDWFYSYVEDIAERNIMTGLNANTFGVSNNLDRGQFATMLFRYAGKCDINTGARADLSKFPDEKKVTAFARDAMEWAVYVGVIKGNEDGTLAPQDNVSRAVCATMISRFISEPQGPQYDSYNADTYTVGTDIPAGEYVLVRDGDQMGMVQLAADEGGINRRFYRIHLIL